MDGGREGGREVGREISAYTQRRQKISVHLLKVRLCVANPVGARKRSADRPAQIFFKATRRYRLGNRGHKKSVSTARPNVEENLSTRGEELDFNSSDLRGDGCLDVC